MPYDVPERKWFGIFIRTEKDYPLQLNYTDEFYSKDPENSPCFVFSFHFGWDICHAEILIFSVALGNFMFLLAKFCFQVMTCIFC